jgi:WhiB family redox-sensing transcriptional regulator
MVAALVPGEWVKHAACSPMTGDLFYREEAGQKPLSEAVALCGMCPVREECGEHALATGEDKGMWGGMSEGFRKKTRAERRRLA